jgi:hypothetical protein
MEFAPLRALFLITTKGVCTVVCRRERVAVYA